MEKIRQQLLLSIEDYAMLSKYATDVHAKNLHDAVHKLLETKESYQRIIKEKQDIIVSYQKALDEKTEQIENYRKLIMGAK